MEVEERNLHQQCLKKIFKILKSILHLKRSQLTDRHLVIDEIITNDHLIINIIKEKEENRSLLKLYSYKALISFLPD